MDSDDRAIRVRADEGRTTEVRQTRLPDGPAGDEAPAEHRLETGVYARQAMVSSALAHDRAAKLLEDMASAHPEEAELHLPSAARHRWWAENDRRLARQYAPRGDDPDGRDESARQTKHDETGAGTSIGNAEA
ncbi:hypothetical protein ACFOY4_01890 [Actinomadura syzygii]|uniref:Uncharacterized protein n=1 Tax=Actinomadura syzygii TaxID=1427538 RepID=A0A5D0TT48_9ACTN|nr:hypothetical protein [Actinomadura syzygii]TYC08516.1 hypothetical protein FXF65_37070 [Actinomadura syzygii]